MDDHLDREVARQAARHWFYRAVAYADTPAAEAQREAFRERNREHYRAWRWIESAVYKECP